MHVHRGVYVILDTTVCGALEEGLAKFLEVFLRRLRYSTLAASRFPPHLVSTCSQHAFALAYNIGQYSFHAIPSS